MPIFRRSARLWPFPCNSLKTGNKDATERGRSLRMSAGRRSEPRSIFCLGSLQGFANGLDRVTRDLQLNSAPEASLVYDRHNNLIFSFASEDRTNVPLDRVSSAMVVGSARRGGSLLLQARGHGPHRPRPRGLGRFEGTGRQAGRQHHHAAARPADCALAGPQLRAAK